MVPFLSRTRVARAAAAGGAWNHFHARSSACPSCPDRPDFHKSLQIIGQRPRALHSVSSSGPFSSQFRQMVPPSRADVWLQWMGVTGSAVPDLFEMSRIVPRKGARPFKSILVEGGAQGVRYHLERQVPWPRPSLLGGM